MLVAVMPAYNEEDNIGKTVREWYYELEAICGDFEFVVINDGSKDGTGDELNKLKEELPKLIVMSKANEGHGATIWMGYKYAIDKKADYVFQTDSDGQTVPREFSRFWQNRDKYDFVIGNRTQRQDGISRVFVTKVLKFVVLLTFHVGVEDANTPFRLMKRERLEYYFNMIPEKYNLTNVALSALACKGKERVHFETITFKQRQGGINSISLKKISKIGINAIKGFVEINRKYVLGTR